MKFIGGKFGAKKRVYDEWADTLKKNRAKGDNGNIDDQLESSEESRAQSKTHLGRGKTAELHPVRIFHSSKKKLKLRI